MAVVSIGRFVLDVRGVDGDFSGLLFGRPIDVLVGHGLAPSLLGEDLGDGLGERGFAVIDVTDGADVDVGFVAGVLLRGEGAGGEGPCGGSG